MEPKGRSGGRAVVLWVLLLMLIAVTLAIAADVSDLDRLGWHLRDSRSMGREGKISDEAYVQALHSLAENYELVSGERSAGEEQDSLTVWACLLYLESAVSERAGHGAPLRSVPSDSWQDYLRVAWQYVETGSAEDGGARGKVVLVDLAELEFRQAHLLGMTYAPAYAEPVLTLYGRAVDRSVRARAGALGAVHMMQYDWAGACSLSQEVATLERQASPLGSAEAYELYRAMMVMELAFVADLNRWSGYLQRGVQLYGERWGTYPAERAIQDPSLLWESVAPFLAEAIMSDAEGWQDASRMDLDSNRLLTRPGLRVKGVDWRRGSDGEAHLALAFQPVLWEEHGYVSRTTTPWFVRKGLRAAEDPQRESKRTRAAQSRR
jgi:hypothetical protein